MRKSQLFLILTYLAVFIKTAIFGGYESTFSLLNGSRWNISYDESTSFLFFKQTPLETTINIIDVLDLDNVHVFPFQTTCLNDGKFRYWFIYVSVLSTNALQVSVYYDDGKNTQMEYLSLQGGMLDADIKHIATKNCLLVSSIEISGINTEEQVKVVQIYVYFCFRDIFLKIEDFYWRDFSGCNFHFVDGSLGVNHIGKYAFVAITDKMIAASEIFGVSLKRANSWWNQFYIL